jgi:hypothetical protein
MSWAQKKKNFGSRVAFKKGVQDREGINLALGFKSNDEFLAKKRKQLTKTIES